MHANQISHAILSPMGSTNRRPSSPVVENAMLHSRDAYRVDFIAVTLVVKKTCSYLVVIVKRAPGREASSWEERSGYPVTERDRSCTVKAKKSFGVGEDLIQVVRWLGSLMSKVHCAFVSTKCLMCYLSGYCRLSRVWILSTLAVATALT
jgi:hypothetical protein